MKKITINELLNAIPDKEHNKHIETKELLRFREHLLPKDKEAEIWKHLSSCKECRDKMANLPKKSSLTIVSYSKLAIAASVLLVFFALPASMNYPDEIHFKGATEEKSFFIKTINYWENRLKDLVDIFTK